jgi:transposase-like protein
MEPTETKTARNHYSDIEIKKFLEEQEQSDLTVKEYCQLYDINEATFYNWRRKFQDKAEAATESFVPMKFIDLNQQERYFLFAELELPSGAILRFFDKVESSYLKSLL